MTVVIPQADVANTRVALSPSFTQGPVGLDPYRPWSVAIIDGVFFLANGYDQPKRWDGTAAFYNMGSTAPTTFALALSAAGSPAALATGNTATYYLVFYNSTLGKETAPQTSSASITNSSGATRDVTVTWADPAGEWDKARIYRRLQGSDTYKLVSTVTASTATYLDASTDAALATATDYVYTYRTTLPPVFKGIGVFQNQLFGWVAGTGVAYYAQPVRIDGRFVADDFKSDYILPIGPNDNRGDIVALRGLYTSAIWYKQRARYEMTGYDASTFEIRKLGGDRGAISSRCILDIDGRALVLDERGLYYDTPGAEPVVAGARPGAPSPLQPVWDRMNLSVADTFFAVLDDVSRLAFFFVALDNEPEPNFAVVYDYGLERFVGLDTDIVATAGGHLYDILGKRHFIYGCDLGFLWENGIGSTQGCTTGTTKPAITSSTNRSLTASAASFETTATTGVIGCPVWRYSTAGVVADRNRVYSATGTALTLYYYATSTAAAGDVGIVGVIPAVALISQLNFRNDEKKFVKEIILTHDNGVSGNVDVLTAMDADTLAAALSVDLTTNIRDYVPILSYGWTFSLQISQQDPGLGFTLRSIGIKFATLPGSRK